MPGKANPGAALHKFTVSGARAFGRTELANPEIARKAAKAQTTRFINRGWSTAGKPPIISSGDAGHLKQGVMGMAARLNANADQLRQLSAMDPDKLAQLYRNNKFVFELVFDYRGITKTGPGGSAVADPSRKADLDFLIGEYNRAFTYEEYNAPTLLDY